eukprot:GHVO01036859.1.p1 GENE.GHVO01036859.1~~GHVO01036859.1.p1  ORF type:complete len:146 (+),score=8.98 GHVO01036859.1:426-863(+)
MSEPQAAPAGRLQATWPANLNQIPVITDYTMQGRTYRYYEGEPLYPFGFGLSYTSFSYTSLSVSPTVIKKGDDVTVEVCLKNTGNYESDEVYKCKSMQHFASSSYSARSSKCTCRGPALLSLFRNGLWLLLLVIRLPWARRCVSS